MDAGHQTEVADGGTAAGGITEYVEVRGKERNTACEALFLPDEEDLLLPLGRHGFNGSSEKAGSNRRTRRQSAVYC